MGRPNVFTGFDAQPADTFDQLAQYAPNATHRYDDGPQHNVPLSSWLTEVRRRGLYYIVQGTACDAQVIDLATLDADPLCLSVAQDDEPNMNRWDSQKNKAPEVELAKRMYTPVLNPPPQASMLGWTDVRVLQERYARWKLKLPSKPISLNLAGPSMTSLWDFNNELSQHRPYFKQCNEVSYDEYPRNTGGEAWLLSFPGLIADKLNKLGIKVAGGYVEGSDQALDGAEGSGRLRGPTPIEQSTMTWSLVARGLRQLWLFTQRVGIPGQFKYMNASPENLAQWVSDQAVMRRCDEVIGTGKCTIDQTPIPNYNAAKPPVVYPASEVITWTLGEKVLRVKIDYSGRFAPVIEEPQAPKPEASYATKAEVDALATRLTELEKREYRVVPA